MDVGVESRVVLPFSRETVAAYAGVRTKMKLRNRGTPTGFVTVAAPMMCMAMARALGQDLARLAERLSALKDSWDDQPNHKENS